MKNTKKQFHIWIFVGLLYAMFITPNAMVVRIATLEADQFYWNMMRFLVVAAICLPFVVISWRKLWHKKVRRWTIAAMISMPIANLTFTAAIAQSQASYVSIINLITPVFLIVLSAFLTRDGISHRAIAGISIAAAGAAVVVALPAYLSQDGVVFYPVATVLVLINSLAYSVNLISIRKMNENSVPFMSIVGIVSLACVANFASLFFAFGDASRAPLDLTFLLMVAYSAIGISIVARIVSIILFEKTNAATVGGLTYLATFIAIILPIILLGERLSTEMLIGGALILTGVYIIESHHRQHIKKHHRHFYWWHHH